MDVNERWQKLYEMQNALEELISRTKEELKFREMQKNNREEKQKENTNKKTLQDR